MANKTYPLTVAGVTRDLPILKLSDTLSIAGFIMLGDVELTLACARELAKRIPPDTEAILTAETKGIPLAAALAEIPRYFVARKSIKAYMENVLWTKDISITTHGVQRLCLDGVDAARIKGRKVLLLDDVISTGGSMKALRILAEEAGAKVIGVPSQKAMLLNVTTLYFSPPFHSLQTPSLCSNESRQHEKHCIIHTAGLQSDRAWQLFLPDRCRRTNRCRQQSKKRRE